VAFPISRPVLVGWQLKKGGKDYFKKTFELLSNCFVFVSIMPKKPENSPPEEEEVILESSGDDDEEEGTTVHAALLKKLHHKRKVAADQDDEEEETRVGTKAMLAAVPNRWARNPRKSSPSRRSRSLSARRRRWRTRSLFSKNRSYPETKATADWTVLCM